MPVTVKIPAPLRPLTANQGEVAVENAGTVQAALEQLSRKYPGIREKLLDDKGALRRYVNIFRNDEDIRHGKMLDTSLGAEDKLTIVPAMLECCFPSTPFPRKPAAKRSSFHGPTKVILPWT